jgi:tetratricopeptide (TPR) repeat protein
LANRGPTPTPSKDSSSTVSREQFLRNKIETRPSELSNYFELAKLHEERHEYGKALEILGQAQTASGGGDLTVRERLEDVQMREGRHSAAIAKKRAADDPKDEAQRLAERLQAQANQRELEIYAARADRDPKNAAWKHELGVRLKTARKFRQAIEVLQTAAKDKRSKAAALLEMGECFQYLEEYDQALRKYRDAVEASGEAELETKKRALYRAGVLATGLRELDQAEGFLRELADLDAQYRDVTTRLDKVTRLRNKE